MEPLVPKIAIVDDDPRLVDLVRKYLIGNGFPEIIPLTPHQAAAGELAGAGLLILDIMMPGLDGFEVLKTLRRTSDIGVIFLSAKSDVFDRVLGLELGADDFLPKPFEPRELLARIQAVLRRRAAPHPEPEPLPAGNEAAVERRGCIAFREFIFDQDRQIIQRGETEHSLTAHEFHLLQVFCANPNIVLTRQQITNWLEANNFGSYDRSIDVGISRLRRKLEADPSRPLVLKTVWGRGYQLAVTRK